MSGRWIVSTDDKTGLHTRAVPKDAIDTERHLVDDKAGSDMATNFLKKMAAVLSNVGG